MRHIPGVQNHELSRPIHGLTFFSGHFETKHVQFLPGGVPNKWYKGSFFSRFHAFGPTEELHIQVSLLPKDPESIVSIIHGLGPLTFLYSFVGSLKNLSGREERTLY